MTLSRDSNAFGDRLERALRDTRTAIDRRRAAEESARQAERRAAADLRSVEDEYVRRLTELVGRVRRPAASGSLTAAPPAGGRRPTAGDAAPAAGGGLGSGAAGRSQGPAESRSGAASAARGTEPPGDPELEAIVSVWKSLAAPARRAILSIVRSSLRAAG